MAEPTNTPLLDRQFLQQTFAKDIPVESISLPNIPFRAPSTPMPSFDPTGLPLVDGEPAPSALSAIENSILSVRSDDGKLTGGSIPRSLYESQSDRYNTFVPGDYNNEDAYAQGQGWPSKMVNGVGKGLLLTGNTLLQTTVGTVNGIARMINDGKASSFYDNALNRWVDDVNKAAEDVLPNYYTDVEKNASWYSPNKLVTANFFWDGIVKNLGFAAGAAASGSIFAAGLRALPLTARLFSVGKAAETLAATEEALLSAGKTAETYGKVKSLSDKFLGSYNALNPLGRGLVSALATTGEAGFEAFHNLNQYRDQKIQEWKDEHGGMDPRGADLDAINSEAESVGNSSFNLNTALLSATNYIQFPKILGSSYTTEKGLINALRKDVGNITQDAAGNFVERQATTRTGRLLSTINKIRPYTFSASEAFEEGAQYAISIGTNDYYNKKYDGDVATFLDSMSEGVMQTLSTDEGAENILIGGLSGALMLGRGRFKAAAEKSKNTADAVQKFNKWKISDFTRETIDAVNRGTVLQKERETLLRQGDILGTKDKEADYVINYLTPRIKYGRYDLVNTDIQEYKQLASTDVGFAQLQAEGKALPGDTREAYVQRLINLETTASNMYSLYQSLNLRYGNLVLPDNTPVYNQEVLDKMIYSATKVADYEKRVLELTTSLLEKSIDTTIIINDIVSGASDAFNAAIVHIEAMDVNADVKETLLRDLSDISELSLRRQAFLKEYDAIKKSPQSFKSQPTVEKPTETIAVKTKDGQEDIVVGEEYFLGRVVEYDKAGKEVYRFPKLTILGENEDGTIKIKDSQGNVKDVSKSVLEDYKLGKVSDTIANKKAKFYMDNANSIFEFNFGKKKKQRGRLEYSPKEGILNFVYKDGKGNVKSIEVTANQFVPKAGFTTPIISKVGTLTAADAASLAEFAAQADERIQAKRTSRLKILNDLHTEIAVSHTKTQKLIEQKKSEIANLNKELGELQKRIETSALTPKRNNLKSTTKKAIQASLRLTRMREQLENEVASLEAERDDLELNADYITDLSQNIDELPTDSKDFLEELKDQRNLLESTILETGKEINTISKLIDDVDKALQSAIDFANDLIGEFTRKYPKVPTAIGQEWIDFLKDNPNFLKLKPNYRTDLSTLEDIVAQIEDIDIVPNERSLKELRDNLTTLQSSLESTEKELKAKDIIISKFEEIAEKYRKQQEEEKKIAKDLALQKELLGTADPGLQTRTYDKDYEPVAKKTNIAVVTSTKAATNSTLPHHIRANTFGANLDKLPNRNKIKTMFVTSKNEEVILPGLTKFLKGTSDVDVNKIVALIMVEIDKDGYWSPVGVDGKPLEEASLDTAIFQVMPDPKLEWSKEYGGGSMFRKETTPEQIEYYKKQYTEWINEILNSPYPHEYKYDIEASFGIPEYVIYLDDKGNAKRDYNAVVSVEEAGLIKSSDLAETPLIKVSTLDTIDKGSTAYTNSLGRPFLNLPNGYVPLQNRKLTKNEAATIYEAIHQLSIDIFKNNNAKSENAIRLQNWLKSIIYWGTPKNKAGYNSVFYGIAADGEFSLFVSGSGNSYSFAPSSLEQHKAEIITLLEGMYNNVKSGLTDKATEWNEPYEEITNISSQGVIESKQWPNYQTYLLSQEGRKAEELPLSVQMKPIKEGETNRTGIYYTIKDTVDRFSAPPTKREVKPVAPIVKAAPVGTFVLDGTTINTFVSPAGKQIKFAAGNSLDSVKIIKGGDLDEVLKALTTQVGEAKAKENILNTIRVAITPQIKTSPADQEYTIPEEEEEKAPASSKIFGKPGVERKPAKIEVTQSDEELMTFQMDDLEDDSPMRVKTQEEIQRFEDENWKKTEEWLKANFPLLPVYRVKNIIQAVNGAEAWGMLKNGAIYVYENAEVGTVYHEVFEGVWKIFATPTEQASIISEFKKRKGSFIDRPTGTTVEYSKATDLQIKEQLAEEFRDYILYKKVPIKPVDGRPFIVKLFSDIVNVIKTFFTGEKAISNTEKLFEKIGTGYYKQYTPTSQLSFAKKGIIDVEEAFASSASEFRVKNIPADVVNEIIQHMTYITLTDLIRDNKSLFSLPRINRKELYEKLKTDLQKTALKSRKAAQELVKQGKFTQAQAAPIIDKSKALWKSITDEWEEIKKKHEEYLKIYSIEFDENDQLELTNEDKAKEDPYGDATKIDTFKKANSAIKLLLSTVPRVSNNGKLVFSSINGVSLLPASEVFMAIMNNVHNSKNIDEMMNRLKDMSEEDVNYKTLYNRLTKNTTDLSQISEVHDAQLIAAFWRTFKKQNPDVKNVYIFENGDVEVGDSNLSSAARQISADYSNAIIKVVKGKNPYFEYSAKERVFVGKPTGVKGVKLDMDQNRINFLKSLGIEFKLNELNKLPGDRLSAFREATAGIKASIEKAEKIATVSRKVLDIKGRLMQLSLVRASIDNPEFDSTFFNVKGERTQSFIGTNPTSDLYDILSQIENKNELLGTSYEYLLTDSFSQNSSILNRMFNPETGNRIKGGEHLMKVGYADGTINTENGKKKQSAKLTYKERLIQEINLNLNGYYYNLVPGDSSMEWMVYMGNPISSTSLLSGYTKVYDIFKGYFLSEVELSRENRPVVGGRNNKDLRFFKSILGEELQDKIVKEKTSGDAIYTKYKSQIDNAIKKFIETESSKFRETLSSYGIVKQDIEGLTVENLSFSEGESITEDVLERNLNALSVNFIINNIELHKLLYSDPYQYSDELKRVKNANSPRQAIISNSPAMNSSLNTIWNEGFNKEDIGYTDMTRDYFRTVTLADIVSSSDLKDYGTFEETDGGGIISMKAYRWFRIKAGEWNEDEERQYKYDIAYEKQQKNITLSSEESKLLKGENPNVKSAYTPLKPIVFGNKANGKEYNDIVLDKFALYPLSYRVAHIINPESNAVKHYNKMQREDIDYSVFSSGRKVGSEGTNALYNTDGSFNQLPYSKLVNIPHSIISIQSEVPSKDEPIVTRGSQITKLVTMDYMEAGIPIDFGKGDFKQRFTAWNALSEEQKLKQSPLYKEIKNNQSLLEAITEEGYRSLLNRMGIQESENGDFVITDFSKVADTLKDEILKREVNDNIIDAFEGFKNGDVVLEATPAYQQIRNILYSLADKNVISPKISGGQKVQIPSTLLESIRAKQEKGAFTSDVLSFYQDEDGKRVAEIMVGRWFESPLSDEELLTYLNKTEEGKKILAGIAYRIPTQKQNSIDSFVIKQFLPREFGDSVIIPSALVKKVGSDFDIDKLFIYFKNIYQDAKGNVKILPFYGFGEQAREKFKDLFLDIRELKIVDAEGKLEKQTKLSSLFGDIALGLREGKIAEKWTPIFQEWFKEELVDGKFPVQRIEEIFMLRLERLNKTLNTLTNDDVQEALSIEIGERWYKQSLENEYIQSLQNLVSDPLNFENLVKPNSADQLKGLAKEITKLTGVGEFDYKVTGNLISRGFMSRLRHSFVSGKYAIGIAAVNQTNHSLNQRQPIYIDINNWDNIPQEDKYWLTGGTMKPEDVTIKFKNFNKIEINDKIVPTLSMIKNSTGENISDIIGQFIDGYVDISKGPWIMELGAAPNVASVWLFLVKVGVPINDVAYFMNQPIIRDYLRMIESAGYSWLFIDDFVEATKDDANYKVSPSELNKIKQIPSNLKSTVGKSKFSPKERAEQQFMLDEFLKYAKMANHMFLVTQGSNFDTATFNDPYLVFKKFEQLKKAESTIISSVSDLINNSFIGKLSEAIYDTRNAFSTVLISDKKNVRRVIQEVLRPYVDLNDRDFVKLAQKAVNDLFDWAVQVDRNLNSQVTNILLSDNNTAKQISDFVVSVRKDEKHPLYNNQVIKLITPHFSSNEGGVNNLKIKNKDNKVYDQNQMIYAFSELRRYLNGQNSSLYGALVRLTVLQSGLSNNPISFTSLLPYEDFKEIYNKTLSTLENMSNLQDFQKMNVFQRNNWSNDDLVPLRRARWKQNSQGDWKYNNNMNFWSNKRVQRAIAQKELPQLVKINTKSREADSDIIVYTWETGTKAQKAEMKKKGDFSYINKALYKKVYQGNEPFTQSYTIGDIVISDFVYKPINAWGDSHSTDGVYFSANEFYSTPKQSVIDNGFLKVAKEVGDETVITYFTSPAPKETDKTKGSDTIPNCI